VTLADWISANLPTETVNGTERVVYLHPDTDCPACGGDHPYPVRETVVVSDLAAGYAVDPETTTDTKAALEAAAKEKGTGHERFFSQAGSA
jgi:hypothetical protein